MLNLFQIWCCWYALCGERCKINKVLLGLSLYLGSQGILFGFCSRYKPHRVPKTEFPNIKIHTAPQLQAFVQQISVWFVLNVPNDNNNLWKELEWKLNYLLRRVFQCFKVPYCIYFYGKITNMKNLFGTQNKT